MTHAVSGLVCTLSVNVVTKVLRSKGLLPSNRLLASTPVARVVDVQHSSRMNVAPSGSLSLRDGRGSGQKAAVKADSNENDRDSSHTSNPVSSCRPDPGTHDVINL